MFRRSRVTPFFFTWQQPDLADLSQKKKYTSPVWVPQEDVNWVTRMISPLKGAGKSGVTAEKTFRIRNLPVRLLLWNMSQLSLTTDVESVVAQPTENDHHVSYSSKKPYAGALQFALEQRVVVSGISNAEQGPKKNYWITPREASKLALQTKPGQKPFAAITKAQKQVYSADQFADPTALEKFPIHLFSSRMEGIESFQRPALQDWHEGHLAAAKADQPQDQADSALPLHDRLAVFARADEYKEMDIQLKDGADGVTVARFYKDSQLAKSGAAARREQLQQDESSSSSSKPKHDPSIPHENDVYFFADIVNQDKLWQDGKSRFKRPEWKEEHAAAAAAAASGSAKPNPLREHYLLPGGAKLVFQSMWPALEEYLAKRVEKGEEEEEEDVRKSLEALPGVAFWVSRGMVKKHGFQLREDAQAVSCFAKAEGAAASSSASEQKLETVTFYHISQTTDPENALKKVGLHTR